MGLWSWAKEKIEQRAFSSGFSDAFEKVIQEFESGNFGNTQKTGALEIAGGLVARSLALVEVEQAPPLLLRALSPLFFANLGRRLIARGEAVHWIKLDDDGLRLYPVSDWSIVQGGYRRESWRYQISVPGPLTTSSATVPADELLHFFYAFQYGSPWEGRGPLQLAPQAGRLNASANEFLTGEFSGSHGGVIPIAKKPSGDQTNPLEEKIKKLRGGTALVPTTAGGFSDVNQKASHGDWNVRGFGGTNIKEAAVSVRGDADLLVGLVCGVPMGLLTKADGTLAREAYRQFFLSTVQPLGLMIQEVLREGLDAPRLSLSFKRLGGLDVQARARAFKSLVDGGVQADEAKRLVGFNE